MGIVQYDYSKLLGKIKEKTLTQETLASGISISLNTLNKKLKNKAYFRQDEIEKICRILGIHDEQIGEYFFCEKS